MRTTPANDRGPRRFKKKYTERWIHEAKYRMTCEDEPGQLMKEDIQIHKAIHGIQVDRYVKSMSTRCTRSVF